MEKTGTYERASTTVMIKIQTLSLSPVQRRTLFETLSWKASKTNHFPKSFQSTSQAGRTLKVFGIDVVKDFPSFPIPIQLNLLPTFSSSTIAKVYLLPIPLPFGSMPWLQPKPNNHQLTFFTRIISGRPSPKTLLGLVKSKTFRPMILTPFSLVLVLLDFSSLEPPDHQFKSLSTKVMLNLMEQVWW